MRCFTYLVFVFFLCVSVTVLFTIPISIVLTSKFDCLLLTNGNTANIAFVYSSISTTHLCARSFVPT